ncbi:uncharacterized protein LAESUDRAFT_720411 [Laetiporus sulphureus 93-53]|uniref:Uncharacterized protein n=1 Tax=Laetiporus sulphureus 93-53 TaxID=1314785 RepID=A0A165H424_9APHY|nr:uncharacterized protein LAESUDRAFT_720411 [Laetiporus sulphureus 93-53]KZT11214.1 hypothetical protein LAESUDRAFT_720411 [Laetiporus sulphureus 93-53]
MRTRGTCFSGTPSPPSWIYVGFGTTPLAFIASSLSFLPHPFSPPRPSRPRTLADTPYPRGTYVTNPFIYS